MAKQTSWSARHPELSDAAIMVAGMAAVAAIAAPLYGLWHWARPLVEYSIGVTLFAGVVAALVLVGWVVAILRLTRGR